LFNRYSSLRSLVDPTRNQDIVTILLAARTADSVFCYMLAEELLVDPLPRDIPWIVGKQEVIRCHRKSCQAGFETALLMTQPGDTSRFRRLGYTPFKCCDIAKACASQAKGYRSGLRTSWPVYAGYLRTANCAPHAASVNGALIVGALRRWVE
jgi:hypothetical protein